MTKVFIPALNQQLKLLEDWTFKFINNWHSGYMGSILTDQRKLPTPDVVTLPAGTVLKVIKYTISKSPYSNNNIKFRIMDGPREFLAKSRGGTAYDSVTFEAYLNCVNTMEVEPCP